MYWSLQLLGRSSQKARNFTASSHQNAGFASEFSKIFGGDWYPRTLTAGGGDPLSHPTAPAFVAPRCWDQNLGPLNFSAMVAPLLLFKHSVLTYLLARWWAMSGTDSWDCSTSSDWSRRDWASSDDRTCQQCQRCRPSVCDQRWNIDLTPSTLTTSVFPPTTSRVASSLYCQLVITTLYRYLFSLYENDKHDYKQTNHKRYKREYKHTDYNSIFTEILRNNHISIKCTNEVKVISAKKNQRSSEHVMSYYYLICVHIGLLGLSPANRVDLFYYPL